jgi:hypothetical protein
MKNLVDDVVAVPVAAGMKLLNSDVNVEHDHTVVVVG